MCQSQLPNDPIMLLSFVNMQLRDHYPSLMDFCKSLMIDEHVIVDKLRSVDYEYDSTTNQFV